MFIVALGIWIRGFRPMYLCWESFLTYLVRIEEQFCSITWLFCFIDTSLWQIWLFTCMSRNANFCPVCTVIAFCDLAEGMFTYDSALACGLAQVNFVNYGHIWHRWTVLDQVLGHPMLECWAHLAHSWHISYAHNIGLCLFCYEESMDSKISNVYEVYLAEWIYLQEHSCNNNNKMDHDYIMTTFL